MQDLTLNRRSLMIGTGAALAAAALARPAAAGLPALPGFRAVQRFSLGDLKITVLDDAQLFLPASIFGVNQPEGAVAAHLTGYGLPGDLANLKMQTMLVEVAGRRVLLDTGMGDIALPGTEADGGRSFAALALLGIAPGDITDVILSHGHPDHVGGCAFRGAPAFPNATYHIAPEELEFWTQKPGTGNEFLDFMLAKGNEKLAPVQAMMKPYKDGDEIVPGITAMAAPGHTVGHYAFLLAGGGQRLLHLMDTAVHHLIGPEEPDWAAGVELDPETAAATRHRLFRLAAEEQILVAGYHYPFPGVGRIVASGKMWRYVPVQIG